MIKIEKNDSTGRQGMIYIFSNKIPTGGPETMHQFAALLMRCGVDVGVVYIDYKRKDIPVRLSSYGIPVMQEKSVVDSEVNMMIVPETFTSYLYNYKKIRKCIWWLSRDFYYGYTNLEGLVRCAQRLKIKRILYPICIPLIYIRHKLTSPYFKFKKDKNKIFHLYNCEYVRVYLEKHGIDENNMLYMCGPIRQEYFGHALAKKEILVTYNPKKNFEYTKRILKALKEKRSDIQCVGISGMESNEIVDLLLRCSVYIDFGHFPGPERIPREAVTCYCNIITSRYGSAKNDIDVLVPTQYKFDANKKNIGKIIDSIVELVDNYSIHVHEYDDYRVKVRNQKQLFEDNAEVFIERFDLRS